MQTCPRLTGSTGDGLRTFQTPQSRSYPQSFGIPDPLVRHFCDRECCLHALRVTPLTFMAIPLQDYSRINPLEGIRNHHRLIWTISTLHIQRCVYSQYVRLSRPVNGPSDRKVSEATLVCVYGHEYVPLLGLDTHQHGGTGLSLRRKFYRSTELSTVHLPNPKLDSLCSTHLSRHGTSPLGSGVSERIVWSEAEPYFTVLQAIDQSRVT
jgi:hypothetical protein